MIVQKIRDSVARGSIIPKPKAKANFLVKGWGRRRGEPTLVYKIPNHSNPEKPYEKGITESEFERAHDQLNESGELTHHWFNDALSACAKEGACNFTTLGGILELLGEAKYSAPGVYKDIR